MRTTDDGSTDDGSTARTTARVTGRHGPRRTWWLVVPTLAMLWPGLYNRHDPEILGVPFFYAYQLLLIVLAAGCMLAAHRRPPR